MLCLERENYSVHAEGTSHDQPQHLPLPYWIAFFLRQTDLFKWAIRRSLSTLLLAAWARGMAGQAAPTCDAKNMASWAAGGRQTDIFGQGRQHLTHQKL